MVVNIVGAGLAGLSAALTLAAAGTPVRLLSRQCSERAQSVLAEGGINAALDSMGDGDTPEQHFADTMHGGADLADPNAVWGLVSAAPDIVRRLHSLGVPFQTAGGRILQRPFGGQKKRRTAYVRASTGKALMTALIDEVRRYEAAGLVERLPSHALAALDCRGGVCLGLSAVDTRTGAGARYPGPVVLCTGGLNGLFPGLTTGSAANGGTGTVLAFAAGAALGNPEFLQYHPTTAAIPGKRLLLSEAARGEGGRLYVLRDGRPWYFMEENYPELGNLMPRDVVSREMEAVCRRSGCAGPVYLDMTGLSPAVWRERLPDLRAELARYLGLDPAAAPVPVSPGIHYFMGGVLVDEGHRSTLAGLYAAGECACQYHGANRLGGNSMLGAVYGGAAAARSVLADGGPGGDPVPDGAAAEPQASFAETAELGAILSGALGILRDGDSLRAALERLADFRSAPGRSAAAGDRAMVGEAMLRAALAREESRGAHWRTDYPARDDARFRKTTVALRRGRSVDITFQPIPERRT